MENFKIELNTQDLQIIMGALVKFPFEQVAGVIAKIQEQMNTNTEGKQNG